LLRKRSEHNEGMVSTLEEIALHQEEIEKIEVIGTLCRKLRILYLQNNIIEKIEDLTHMKDLRYLNLALNNIKKIEGLGSCEFLEKLDLTVNFIDVDTLEESIELYMLGNPAQSDWENFTHYVVASLPQLQQLDGKDITKSDRIKALQKLPVFKKELAALIQAKRVRDTADMDVIPVVSGAATDISKDGGIDNQDEKLPYTPETRRSTLRMMCRHTNTIARSDQSRVDMYMELAEQKEEEDARKRSNMPKERDYAREHADALAKARYEWAFHMDEESKPGFVLVEVGVPKFLDSSLIHVDMHPTYVSILIKNKLLRLRFPDEVLDPASIQRARRARQRRQDEKDEDAKSNQATHDAAAARRPGTIQDQIALHTICSMLVLQTSLVAVLAAAAASGLATAVGPSITLNGWFSCTEETFWHPPSSSNRRRLHEAAAPFGSPPVPDGAQCGQYSVPLCHPGVCNSTDDTIQVFVKRLVGSTSKVFLYGVSYGTLWLQRFVVVQPPTMTNVHGFVLDGVVPHHGARRLYMHDWDTNMDSVGREFLALCDADSFCQSQFPPPSSSIAQSLQALYRDTHPSAYVEYNNDMSISVGVSYRGWVVCRAYIKDMLDGPYGLKVVLSVLLTHSTLRLLIPVLVHRLHRGTPGDLDVVTYMLDILSDPWTGHDDESLSYDSDLLYSTVVYSELWQHPTPSEASILNTFVRGLFGYGVVGMFPSYCVYTNDPTPDCDAHRVPFRHKTRVVSVLRLLVYFNKALRSLPPQTTLEQPTTLPPSTAATTTTNKEGAGVVLGNTPTAAPLPPPSSSTNMAESMVGLLGCLLVVTGIVAVKYFVEAKRLRRHMPLEEDVA
ncbi:hypothetical protein DYB35_010258, partial [Aphanomyces astaci]